MPAAMLLGLWLSIACGCAMTEGRALTFGDLRAAGVPPAPATTTGMPPLDYQSWTLDNGLAVYAMRDTTTPYVMVSMWYGVGAKHDPQGMSGFAHLFEHLLSRKTVNMPYNMINEMTESVGGTRNAGTAHDFTNYYEIVPSEFLERMLWTHAERLDRSIIDAEVFESEREAVYNEIKGLLGSPYGPPGVLGNIVLPRYSLDVIPQRRANVGSIEDLKSATLQTALGFREAYYGPDTATLIVSGNFDHGRLRASVQEHFAGIAKRSDGPAIDLGVVEPPRAGPQRTTVHAPAVPAPAVAMSWKIPPAAHADIPALWVIDAILTRGQNSRLSDALVRGKQLASSFKPSFSAFRDGGYYAIYAISSGSGHIDALEAAMAASVQQALTGGITEEELTEAKAELLARALRLRETIEGRAFDLGESILIYGTASRYDEHLAKLAQVTREEVEAVAKRYLQPEQRLTIHYLDESQRPRNTPQRPENPHEATAFSPPPPPTRKEQRSPAAVDARQLPPSPGSPMPVSLPEIEQVTLDNGLRISAAHSGRLPLVTMTVVIHGGASSDPAGKQGVAELMAMVAARGQAPSGESPARALEKLGATLRATTDRDATTLSVTAPAQHLREVGAILGRMVQEPLVDAAELDAARARLSTAASIALQSPAELSKLVVQPVVFGLHPYGAIPTPETLSRITVADLHEHRSRWWTANNAAVIVAGGLEPNAALASAREAFESWKAGIGKKRPDVTGSTQPGGAARTIVVDMPGAQQAFVVAVVQAPPRSDPAYWDVAVANSVLGFGTTSRLFRELRSNRDLSYGPGSTMFPRRHGSELVAWAPTDNARAVEAAGALIREIDSLGRSIGTKEVAAKKMFILGSLDRRLQTTDGFATVLAEMVQQGVEPNELLRVRAQIEKVDADSSSEAARDLLAHQPVHLLVVGDASVFLEALRSVRTNVEVHDGAGFDPNIVRSPPAPRR